MPNPMLTASHKRLTICEEQRSQWKQLENELSRVPTEAWLESRPQYGKLVVDDDHADHHIVRRVVHVTGLGLSYDLPWIHVVG